MPSPVVDSYRNYNDLEMKGKVPIQTPPHPISRWGGAIMSDLEFRDQVDERAFVILGQVGQVIRECAKVIAHTNLHVIAKMFVNRAQNTRLGRASRL